MKFRISDYSSCCLLTKIEQDWFHKILKAIQDPFKKDLNIWMQPFRIVIYFILFLSCRIVQSINTSLLFVNFHLKSNDLEHCYVSVCHISKTLFYTSRIFNKNHYIVHYTLTSIHQDFLNYLQAYRLFHMQSVTRVQCFNFNYLLFLFALCSTASAPYTIAVMAPLASMHTSL